jgi:hypothetical protein
MQALNQEQQDFVRYFFQLQQEYDRARAMMLEAREKMGSQRRNMEALLMSMYDRRLAYSDGRYFAMQKKWKHAKRGEKHTLQVLKHSILELQPGLTERDAEHMAGFINSRLFHKEQDGYQYILRKQVPSKKKAQKQAEQAQAQAQAQALHAQQALDFSQAQQHTHIGFGFAQ